MERRMPKQSEGQGGGLYHKKPTTDLRFIKSGSTLLDLVNGTALGSWPIGRMTNLIGDKSTGKTLLATEGFANFHRDYPKGKMYYRESEAAFDRGYAESLGMPINKIDFGGKGQRWALIEEVYEDLKQRAAEHKKLKQPGIYVIDSLDALTTKIDMARDFGEQTYRTDKPTQLGELFRKLVHPLEEAEIALIVISQVRANIGAMFGDKTSRSGGAAMDFYASVINKLAHLKQNSETRHGVKRVTSIRVKARNTKSKVGEPFRNCEFNIRFGYGINDAASCLEWLIEVKRFKEVDKSLGSIEKAKDLLAYLNDLDQSAMEEWADIIRETTCTVWADVEQSFRPTMRKY